MPDNPASPLLQSMDSEPQPSDRSNQSVRSHRSHRSQPPLNSSRSDESTPLLSRDSDSPYRDDPLYDENSHSTAASLRSLRGDNGSKKKSRWRWPMVAATATLVSVLLVALVLACVIPSAVEEYAKQAKVVKPIDLSIKSFTSDGVQARIQAEFFLDSSKVEKKSVRDLGRFGTWLAGAVETRPTTVEVSLPEYGNVILGTADVPGIVVSTRDGHVTRIDVVTELKPAEVDGLRNIAVDWLEGRLGQLRVQGKAEVGLKSGIFGLGTQSIVESLTLQASDLPTMPQYKIEKLNIHETVLPGEKNGMSADVAVSAFNSYPVTFTVPPLAFDILVAGCSSDAPFIKLANATTSEIKVSPKHLVKVDAEGSVRQIDDTLLSVCPGSGASPLDALLKGYIHGAETIIYVTGADSPSQDTPAWMSELTKSVTVPVPLSAGSMDKLIREFSMEDVHMGLPNPMADPNSPGAQPKISATVKVLADLPKEMNFPVSVSRVRSTADIFYEGDKFGVLELEEWQRAESRRIEAHDKIPAGLEIIAVVKDAPLKVTDSDVFSTIIAKMLFGGSVVLKAKAAVDVEVSTALGKFIIRDVPAQGEVPIKPLPKGGDLKSLMPKIGGLKIIGTTPTSMLMEVQANVTNPTNYSATVPYVNINVLNNGSILGQAIGRDINLLPGANNNVPIQLQWSPFSLGGESGAEESRQLISKYLSNYNTSLTFQTHNGTFPSNPYLGSALSVFDLEVPLPKLRLPTKPGDGDDDEEDRPHFIQDTTMHLLTSTATFTLVSPLKQTTVVVTHLNVTAFYNHTEPVGSIIYDLPIAVRPGSTKTPRLPVDWILDGLGYSAVKDAIGGSLKLDSKAQISFRVGEFHDDIWFEGKGLGAHVQL